MKINQQKMVQVDAKLLKVYIKVRDGFAADLVDTEGDTIKDYEGYVPEFFPGDHYGDYLILDIDINTGQITNWQRPTTAELEAFINSENL